MIYDVRYKLTTLYCSRCGEKKVLVDDFDDYYQMSGTYCLNCGYCGCMEDFTYWEGVQSFVVVGGMP